MSATTVTGTTRLLSATGTTGTAVLSIARGHRPVPLRFVGRGTAVVGPARGEVDFSRWGERIRLRTPAGAVPARSVRR